MAKYTKAELSLIWLDSFTNISYKNKRELYNLINGKESIIDVLKSQKNLAINLVGEKEYEKLLNSANASYLKYVSNALESRGITAVTHESQSYPESLKETPFPPLVLYAKGRIELLNSDCFAVVGSRKSLPLSIKATEDFCAELSSAGLTLVTGIAEGVDETVLKTALDNTGNVISVLGGGFDTIYPSKNSELVDKVVEKGLVITEYLPEIKAVPHHFPIRNRIIAGLAKGVLVISGEIRSGTQYTANYAVEYGRDLFALPYNVGVKSGAGCNDLIKRGALLCDSPQDILSFYGLTKAEKNKLPFTKEEKEILAVLKDGDMHVEQIARAINKQVFEVSCLLSFLEVRGAVNKNGVNVYGITINGLEE